MLKKYNVFDNNRFASCIILISFILSFAILRIIFDVQYLLVDWVLRIFLICSLLPLFIVAYKQNQYLVTYPLIIDKRRIFYKSILFIFQYIAILLLVRIFNRFVEGFYNSFIDDAWLFLPFFILLSPCYIYWVERKVPEHLQDEYSKMYYIIVNRVWDKEIVKIFLLKFLLKLIFVPFMYSGILNNLSILLYTPLDMEIKKFSLLLFNIGITFDMLVAIFGYLVSSSLVNNQIKDVDNNFIGWLFALLCYPPLVVISEFVNQQQDTLLWYDIIPENTILYFIFFILINSLWIIYWLSTAEFGMTFANLSYRRLVSTGVYRYTKHPAYLSKNIYWWLYTLPFCGVILFSIEWWQNVLGLVFTSLLYYGRALSEERYLKKFPEYRAYSESVKQHGILRILNKFKK